jgi:hypothetical protein
MNAHPKLAAIVLLSTLAACQRQSAPARLVVGLGDSIVINKFRPVQLSTQIA